MRLPFSERFPPLKASACCEVMLPLGSVRILC